MTTILGRVKPASSPILSKIERISISLRVRSMRSSLESADGSAASTTTGNEAAMVAATVASGAGSRCGFLPFPRVYPLSSPPYSSSPSSSSFRSKVSLTLSLNLASRPSSPSAASAQTVDAVSLTDL